VSSFPRERIELVAGEQTRLQALIGQTVLVEGRVKAGKPPFVLHVRRVSNP